MADKAGDALLLSLSVFSIKLFALILFTTYALSLLQPRKEKISFVSLVLLTHPGQYGSVSGPGACCASDDLVHRAPAWVNSLRLPIHWQNVDIGPEPS